MTLALQLLDTLGRAPALGTTDGAYDQAVAALDLEPALRDALLRRDQAGLAALLGARSRMVFAICTPDNEEAPERSPDREEDAPGGDEPSPQDD